MEEKQDTEGSCIRIEEKSEQTNGGCTVRDDVEFEFNMEFKAWRKSSPRKSRKRFNISIRTNKFAWWKTGLTLTLDPNP